MDYSYITEPIIGAIIGYSTNWIAIKMMFRPRKPIMIGKFKLPFTPGIIPKNRENIAKTISGAITNSLLTQEDLKKSFLSKEMTERVKDIISNAIYKNETSIKELVLDNLGNKDYEKVYNIIVEKISNNIYNNIKEKDIGRIVTNQIENAVERKMSGSILGIFWGKKVAQTIIDNIEEQIDDYVNSKGETTIKEMVANEIDDYMSIKISNVSNIKIEEIIIKVYEKIIANILPMMLEKIEIAKIIEKKINDMNIEELEKLILGIMKKELTAIVNLGAVIGFLLGMSNLAF